MRTPIDEINARQAPTDTRLRILPRCRMVMSFPFQTASTLITQIRQTARVSQYLGSIRAALQGALYFGHRHAGQQKRRLKDVSGAAVETDRSVSAQLRHR